MADKKIALDLEVNIKKGDMTLGELNKQLQDLGTNIQEQKDILIEFEKELLDLDKIQASTSKTELARQTELKDKQEELKVAIKDQRLAIKDLTNEQSKASGEVNAYNKELENTKKGLDKTAEAQKKAATGSGIFSKGLKAVGTAFKALGIGVVVAGLKFLFDALSKNQKVLDAVSTVTETVGIVLAQVVTVVANVVEQVSASSKGFDGLKNVMLGLLRIAITPLQLAFYGIKLGIEQGQLAWEQSFFGSKDPATIKALTKSIGETKDSIAEVAKEAVKAGSQVGSNLGKAIGEVSQVVTASVDGISKISVSGALEQAKANVAIKNSAQTAAATQALLVEEYDRQAEKLRQIRDEERNSIEVRKQANDDLNLVLDAQEKAMLSQADLLIQAAKAEERKGKNAETTAAKIEAQGNKLGVLAQIEGLRSEQKMNDLALDRESIELTNSKSESESLLAYERKKFDAEQITDKLKSAEVLKQIELDREKDETLRLQNIIKATTAGTQAEADAIIALNEFKEVSRQANLSAEAKILQEKQALVLKDLEAQKNISERDFTARRDDLKRRQTLLAEDDKIDKDKRKELEAQFAAELVAITKDETQTRAELNKLLVDAGAKTLNSLVSYVQASSRAEEDRLQNILNNTEEGTQAQLDAAAALEKQKEKSFKLNQQEAIGRTLIDTAQGAIKAYTSQLIPGDPTSVIRGALAAAAIAASGALQIATIKKQKYYGSGSGGVTSPTAPTLGSGGAGSAPVGFTQNLNNTQTPTTKVIVTETDIRRATRNIDGIYSKAVVVE
jgi:hypothetical protein